MSLKPEELTTGCLVCSLYDYFGDTSLDKLGHTNNTPVYYDKVTNKCEPIWWWWYEAYRNKTGQTNVFSLTRFKDIPNPENLLKRFKGLDSSWGQEWIDNVTSMSNISAGTWIELFELELKRRGMGYTTSSPVSDRDGDF
jgi:hypothetical protein